MTWLLRLCVSRTREASFSVRDRSTWSRARGRSEVSLNDPFKFLTPHARAIYKQHWWMFICQIQERVKCGIHHRQLLPLKKAQAGKKRKKSKKKYIAENHKLFEAQNMIGVACTMNVGLCFTILPLILPQIFRKQKSRKSFYLIMLL